MEFIWVHFWFRLKILYRSLILWYVGFKCLKLLRFNVEIWRSNIRIDKFEKKFWDCWSGKMYVECIWIVWTNILEFGRSILQISPFFTFGTKSCRHISQKSSHKAFRRVSKLFLLKCSSENIAFYLIKSSIAITSFRKPLKCYKLIFPHIQTQHMLFKLKNNWTNILKFCTGFLQKTHLRVKSWTYFHTQINSELIIFSIF